MWIEAKLDGKEDCWLNTDYIESVFFVSDQEAAVYMVGEDCKYITDRESMTSWMNKVNRSSTVEMNQIIRGRSER